MRVFVDQRFSTFSQTLIPHYKVLIYSGNLDIIVGAPLTDAFMTKLVFNGSGKAEGNGGGGAS